MYSVSNRSDTEEKCLPRKLKFPDLHQHRKEEKVTDERDQRIEREQI